MTLRLAVAVLVLLLVPVVSAAAAPAAGTAQRVDTRGGGCAMVRTGTVLAASSVSCHDIGSTRAHHPRGAAAPTTGIAPCPAGAAILRCPSWTSAHNGPGGGRDVYGTFIGHRMLVAGGDGQTATAVGSTDVEQGPGTTFGMVVSTVDAASGAPLSTRTVVGSSGREVEATGAAATIHGPVAGARFVGVAGSLLVALDERGDERWRAESGDGMEGLTSSPDGTVVVRTGSSPDGGAVTAALDAEDGSVLWRDVFEPGTRTGGWRVAVDDANDRTYTAATVIDEDSGITIDLVLLVHDLATGELLTATHHPTVGFPPAGIAAVPGGGVAMIAASSELGTTSALTTLYERNGDVRWRAHAKLCDAFKCSLRPWYNGAVAVSDDGDTVLISGLGVTVTGGTSFGTIGYDAASGAQRFLSILPGNLLDCFCGPTVEASADTGYVSGTLHGAVVTADTSTAAYALSDGMARWTGVLRGVPETAAVGQAVLTGSHLVVAGSLGAPVASGDDASDALLASYLR